VRVQCHTPGPSLPCHGRIPLDEQTKAELLVWRKVPNQAHQLDANFLHLNAARDNPFFNLLSRNTHAQFFFAPEIGKWTVRSLPDPCIFIIAKKGVSTVTTVS
jgi:hypothetical protein